jgi:phenylpyruvate tautomerase PptA (4-oxalocrotonate tautomerase family)
MSYFTGPYLRIYAPEFSLEQRKIMASELTDAIAAALHLNENRRNGVQVHFCSCRSDSLAIGGRLLSETEESYYLLEFHDFALNQERKALGRHLMPLLLELLSIPPAEQCRVSLIFHEVPPGDLIIGHHRLAEPATSSA